MWDNFLSYASSGEFWKYLSIPFISAFVGYITNVVALKMTFYPLEFTGIWKIGWQGIVPNKAGEMAGKSVDLLTKRLITIEDRFEQIEPERVAEELEPVLNRITIQIINESMEEQVPVLWESTPPILKNRIYQKSSDDLPEVVEDLMIDVKTNITDLFDLRSMVVEALENDRELLNRIFLDVGTNEFKFIERSGFYFGFLFGLIQMGLFWYFSKAGFAVGWILPVAGLLVGWATNVLALKMIFEPLRPRKLGPWTVHGLFLKRQMEVADAYAKIVASQILTSQKIFETMVSGKTADRLASLVQSHVKRAVDMTAGFTKSILQITQGTQTYLGIKNRMAQRFVDELPHAIKHIFAYAEEALDIENTLRTRMQALGPVEFCGFLRPVFQKDEWKLILVGAVLGFIAGLMQLVWVFGGGF